MNVIKFNPQIRQSLKTIFTDDSNNDREKQLMIIFSEEARRG